MGAPQRSNTMAMLAVLGLGALSLLCCLGTVVVVGTPGLFRIIATPPRSPQSEVKTYLKSAYTAERAYFGEKDDYAGEIEKMGFLPERGNRYLYLVTPGGDVLTPGAPSGAHGLIAVDPMKVPAAVTSAYVAAIPPALLAEAGVHGTCPDACWVTVIAVGNVDKDADLDVWSISTRDRTYGGVPVPAGQPFNHHDDLK